MTKADILRLRPHAIVAGVFLLLAAIGCDKGNQVVIVNFSNYQIDIAYPEMGTAPKWTIPSHSAKQIAYWKADASLKITDHATGKELAPAFAPRENLISEINGTPMAKFDMMVAR